MKQFHLVVIFLVLGALLSSCGAIPTLPPLDSTVTVLTPYSEEATEPGDPTGQAQGQESTEMPSESPTTPPETAEVVVKPTQTALAPSETPLPASTATATSEAPAQPTPTFTPVTFPYALQVMNPHYLGNFSRPELGCDWLGVGGQVFNEAGAVQKDIIIKAGGELNGAPVLEEMTMPLAEPEVDIAYGPGGYELTLANAPAESEDTLWVQLFSLDGTPLSEQIYLITHAECSKNLLLMNFIEQ